MKNKLNDSIRTKIALQIVLNPKNTHQQIADFYGISRQLVTAIAQENKLQRTCIKGTQGSHTYPKRSRANFDKINDLYTYMDSDTFMRVINEKFLVFY